MKHKIVSLILILLAISSLRAAGPANIETGLQMWLDASSLSLINNDPVSSWTDLSGTNKNATQDTLAMRPLYKTNMINGKPAVVFDGINDYLAFDGSIIVNTNYTIITVLKRTSSTPSSHHYFLGGTENAQNKNLHLGWRVNGTFTHAPYTNDYDMRVSNYAAGDPANIFSFRHSTTAGKDTYINGALRGLNMNAAVSGRFAHLTDWKGASIGRYIDGAINNRFNGWMAELIVYNRYLTETERKAIEAYLANKYALTTYNTASPEHYNDLFELTVLSTKTTETKSSGGLSIKGDYLTAFSRIRAGHDNKTGLSTTFNPDSSAYPNFIRLAREWFIEVTSSNINTVFSFDMASLQPELGNPTGTNYRLLYRNNNNSNYTVLSSSPTINGTVVSFTVNPSVSVTSSGLYSMGTIEAEELTLPVELSSFLGVLTPANNVRLEWITQSETGVSGYYLLRNSSPLLASATIVSPLIPAQNTSLGASYNWTDAELAEPGIYYYWLQNQNLNGSHEFHGPISVNYQTGDNPPPAIPLLTGIRSTYPNPFNPTLSISYGIKETADVQIRIYNMKGQLQKSWTIAKHNPGLNTLVWEAGEAPSGVYMIDLIAGNLRETKKVTLSK